MIATLTLFFTGLLYTLADTTDYNSKIVFYHGSKIDSYPLNKAEKLYDNSNFLKTRPTVIYLHGFTASPDSNTAKAVVDAYIGNDSFNILILDWSELAADYLKAISNIDELGTEVAKFIRKMIARGYSINKIHLVGHSLGAQLAGFVGRSIKSLSKNSQILPRITGLDPAGPAFYCNLIPCNIEAIKGTDASLVDIIHSDAGFYGAPVNTGTIDFWPNDGRRPQPGCPVIGPCSHRRAVDLWAESVANKGKVSFTSQNKINSAIKIQMGINCPTNAQPGSYSLDTNSKSPYSRG